MGDGTPDDDGRNRRVGPRAARRPRVTAIDTNVIVDLLEAPPEARERALHALEISARRGPLVLAPIVYAELGARPHGRPAECDDLLRDLRIRVDWALSEGTWRLAADRFREHAARRRRSGSESPRRLIADFVIGAHAAGVGALLTRDAAFFRRAFPGLNVQEP
ncbi:MAG: type II toxin-antitoxin system VapC family toxin [Vulcanimicrobiaceae bacterium]